MGRKKKKQVSPEEVEKLLKRLYLSGWKPAQIARRVQKQEEEVKLRLTEIRKSLEHIYKMM